MDVEIDAHNHDAMTGTVNVYNFTKEQNPVDDDGEFFGKFTIQALRRIQ